MTDPRNLIVNRKINPLLESLPDWMTEYRRHQVAAIDSVVEAFNRVDVVLLSAPTGSGKTLIGETVRRILQSNALYVCSSKSLQDQFVRDYPYAKVLKGRSNYPTILRAKDFHPERIMGHISAEDCTWQPDSPCKFCPNKQQCPYELAKTEALKAEVAVLNTSYLLSEANNVGKFSNNSFVIVDEADSLEQTLMSHVSVDIGERRLKSLKWEPPEKVTVESSWAEWIDEKVPKIRQMMAKLPDEMSLSEAREFRYLDNLLDKLTFIRKGLDDGYWVYTGRGRHDSDNRGVSFKPARVDSIAPLMLWKHSNKWLLMSATIISSDELMESLGYQGNYETVSVANTFPVENRRVYFRGAVSMSFRNRENGSWDTLAESVAKDLTKHPNDRVLVHSVSYALTEHLFQRLVGGGREVIRYTNASEREEALARFLDHSGSVLLAPSLARGIDLPDDACRVQMIVKVPFPYIKDRQINKRMHSRGGQTWYTVQTIRELVQMCGRAVRSETDWAVTYIYDSDFQNQLWNKGRNLFPDWFREGIVWRR